ncbi:MAG: sigma-70 family RNA polymerase sigma factor [Myxococcales bacterium]|nr:sigma-70 family RNA polymerase sigma factor [Myxococcales bacterium]
MLGLVERAFAEPMPDFTAWRALSARLRPIVRRRTDAECDRRLGALATGGDRAEAFDLVWRHLVADGGAVIRRAAVEADFDAAITDWVLDASGPLLVVLDRRLIQRWLAGDPRAGNHLGARLRAVVYARVHRVLRRRGETGAAVDDAAQEAWLHVTSALSSWRPDGGTSLENWVGTATERATRTRVRDASRLKRGGDVIRVSLDDAFALPSDALDPEESARLAAAAAAIEAAARDAMSSRARAMAEALLDGRSVDEVAAAFGVRAGQVYKAKAALKKVSQQVLDL